MELAAKFELVCEEGRSVPGFEVHTTDGRVIVVEEQTIDRSIHTPTITGMENKFIVLASDYPGKVLTEELISLVMN